MATIVQHRSSGERFVLLGAGYGKSESAQRNFLGFDVVKGNDVSLACVANTAGELGWVKISQLTVVSVDGESLQRALRPQDVVDGP